MPPVHASVDAGGWKEALDMLVWPTMYRSHLSVWDLVAIHKFICKECIATVGAYSQILLACFCRVYFGPLTSLFPCFLYFPTSTSQLIHKQNESVVTMKLLTL